MDDLTAARARAEAEGWTLPPDATLEDITAALDHQQTAAVAVAAPTSPPIWWTRRRPKRVG